MIDFLKGTVGKDYFSDRLYGCQECIAEYLASKEPPTEMKFFAALKPMKYNHQRALHRRTSFRICFKEATCFYKPIILLNDMWLPLVKGNADSK